MIGVSPSSVSRWKQQLKQGGLDALRAKPHPGRSPKLTAEQKKELEGILLKDARAAVFPTDLWTLKRVAQVIAREFGVTYHPGYVWYILKRMGWSPQKPERRARERDAEAIAAWAPRGETPILYSWDRHDRLSAITGITVSPVQHRLGLHFQIHDQNINFERVIEFITLLHRHLRGKFILVLDRYSAHRKAVRLLQEEHPDWFEVEWLPAYAPDLNPVEMVWNHSKYSDLPTLSLRMWMISIRRSPPHWKMRTQTSLLRSFFQYAGLEL